jgi:hypothetical protein
MHRLLILFLILSTSICAKEEHMIFTESSIGPMKIKENMEISLYKISQTFPYYKVTQRIGQGDSPDFHSFTVSTWEGEELIEFISYINKKEDYEKSIVKLDEVITCNEKVKDNYGISPKTKFKVADKSRDNMTYGDGHMDNFLGKDKLWYLFTVPNGQFNRGNRELAEKVNPAIQCISWPYPRWL